MTEEREQYDSRGPIERAAATMSAGQGQQPKGQPHAASAPNRLMEPDEKSEVGQAERHLHTALTSLEFSVVTVLHKYRRVMSNVPKTGIKDLANVDQVRQDTVPVADLLHMQAERVERCVSLLQAMAEHSHV